MDDMTEMQETLVTLTADIAAEYMGNNNVAVSDIELVIAEHLSRRCRS